MDRHGFGERYMFDPKLGRLFIIDFREFYQPGRLYCNINSGTIYLFKEFGDDDVTLINSASLDLLGNLKLGKGCSPLRSDLLPFRPVTEEEELNFVERLKRSGHSLEIVSDRLFRLG